MNKSQLHSAVQRLEAYRRLSPRARSVYQLLWGFAGGAEEAGGGGWMLTCRARVDTIQEAESCSRRTVLYALEELERAGLIARARTGRAALITLFAGPVAAPHAAPERCSPLHIRGAAGCTSEVQPVAHRAAPSICLDQDHLTKTTTPAREPHDPAAAVSRASRKPEPPHRPRPAEPSPALDGAAAVALELLTGPECPRAVRFETPADRGQVRRLVSALAASSRPVVEIVRYALDAARAPGVRNGRAYIVSILREPDFHEVVEHARRVRESAGARERSEALARQRALAEQARRERESAWALAAEQAIARASPEQLAEAVRRAAERAHPPLARRLREASPEEIRARGSLRGPVAAQLHAMHRDAAVA